MPISSFVIYAELLPRTKFCEMFNSTGLRRLQCLTFRRQFGRKPAGPAKPPILPPSKTVMYKVPQGKWENPENVKELLWRRHVYNNAIESIRNVFAQEIAHKEGSGIESIRKEELEELDRLIIENEKHNKEVAEARLKRDNEKMEEFRLDVLKEIEEQLAVDEKVNEEKTKEVEDVIKRSAHFVNMENMEEKILEALESPVVYDYAIDLEGTKFYDPLPVKYQTGTPARQTRRLYDRTLAFSGGRKSKQIEERPPDVTEDETV